MKITIEGTPKEIADLVSELRSQPEKVICKVNVDGKAIAQTASSTIRDSIARVLE